MPLFRSKAEEKLVERGLDPSRLPPGQYLTDKWPVLHAGSVPETDLATWDLRVFGEVERPVTLTWDELQALPSTEITVDVHCVTRWSRFDTSFRGVHWRELAKLAEPKPSARFVVAHAEQGFTSNVPLTLLEEDESLVAYEADGAPLTPEHGWPLRLVVPQRYFWKSAKWLRALPEVALWDDEPEGPAVLGGQGRAVGLVGDQRLVLLEQRERDVRREALLGVGDDEAGARLRLGELRQLAPVDAAEARVEAAPARHAVDVDGDLGARKRLELVPCARDRPLDFAEDAEVPRGQVGLRDRAGMEHRPLLGQVLPGRE